MGALGEEEVRGIRGGGGGSMSLRISGCLEFGNIFLLKKVPSY